MAVSVATAGRAKKVATIMMSTVCLMAGYLWLSHRPCCLIQLYGSRDSMATESQRHKGQSR